MTTLRAALAAAVLVAAWPRPAAAQSPANTDSLMVLNARAAALGGAWVAGRDQDVVFTNPAQMIGGRSDVAVTLLRNHATDRGAAFGSTYAGGKYSFTLGWGLQSDERHAAAALAGAIQWKTIKFGATAKYAASRTAAEHAWLIDAGVARSLWNGTAGIAVRNLGGDTNYAWRDARFARQVVAGYSLSRPAGPLDLAAFGEVGRRSGWTSGAAGVEAGYSWLEGLSATVRAGVRRPETRDETPFTLGAGFAADRLTIDYAIRLHDGGRHSQVVTLRWR